MAEPSRPFAPYGWHRRLVDALMLAGIVLTALIVDTLLPPERIETAVHPMTYRHGSAIVDYVIPLSGGDMGRCATDDKTFLDLAPLDAIIVERTALFSRCLGVRPMATIAQ
ncbi:hypothetical protein [Azonexus sp. IMCC34839]|uniref:hypothetical protein n=1 Tax=Azonexus sp. IMCC34839 TaxID=3133695 RepID=UPI00399C1F25